jgi:hypothetical protein
MAHTGQKSTNPGDAGFLVISASRRTDIPGDPAKLEAFFGMLRKGQFEYPNPMTGVAVRRPVSPGAVIDMWSKNFQHFVEALHGSSGQKRQIPEKSTLPAKATDRCDKTASVGFGRNRRIS